MSSWEGKTRTEQIRPPNDDLAYYRIVTGHRLVPLFSAISHIQAEFLGLVHPLDALDNQRISVA